MVWQGNERRTHRCYQLASIKEESGEENNGESIFAPGVTADPAAVVQDLLAISPGEEEYADAKRENCQLIR
jgi:hypothetical protein